MQSRTPRSYAQAVPTGDYPRGTLVLLYMDIHTVHGGATVDGIARACTADLKAQGAHDVRYLRYCRKSSTGSAASTPRAGSPTGRRSPRWAGAAVTG
jgi:hypothetical protein